MSCKKLKCYEGLVDVLDKYDKYIDFQYKAVINIWSSLGFIEKSEFVDYYKKFLKELKGIDEEYYKAQKSLYSCLKLTKRFPCINECTCISNDLSTSLERSLFFKVYSKLNRLNTKIFNDFNLLCKEFMQCVCYDELDWSKHNIYI